MAALTALAALLPGAAPAEEIVLGLSADNVAITTTFDGSDLLVFGAVKRDAPAPAGPPLEVIVTVSGPLTPVTVREKERILGLWVNRDWIRVSAAPSFYAIATTGPLRDILTETEDLRQSVTIPRAIRSLGHDIENAGDFVDALIRIRTAQGVYRVQEGAVELEQETLFRASFDLPSNLIEGTYHARIFLTREGELVDRLDATITVEKVGLERWLFNLSRQGPFLYGLLSLVLAAVAGWAASAAAQAIRR
ncbi:MAG: TIGR02186 family protein [Rubellimicrobium sp.]|nr:TIGR02186 family protein [Rubellimicrobium sp.]